MVADFQSIPVRSEPTAPYTWCPHRWNIQRSVSRLGRTVYNTQGSACPNPTIREVCGYMGMPNSLIKAKCHASLAMTKEKLPHPWDEPVAHVLGIFLIACQLFLQGPVFKGGADEQDHK